jgi:hypothetical protein
LSPKNYLTADALSARSIPASRERDALDSLEAGPGTLAPAGSRLQSWHLCLLAGLLTIACRLALLPLVPIPVPQVHDEFSYLLGADTFASGRVTNPPHPLWVHFETFHENPLPTYCSKYPPAQALFLAAGQVLFGHPWFGVCLSMGVLAAAVCWMLQGWVSRNYALLTTFLAILVWGLSGLWMNSYWGGAVAGAGGALVIGAVPRLLRKPGVTPSLLGSIGLMLLANSRPFEGFLLAGSATVLTAWRIHRGKPGFPTLLTARTVVPFILITAPAVAAMGYYNYRTTGSPRLFPYSVNQRMYAASPLFYLLPAGPVPVYRHEILRKSWVGTVRAHYFAVRKHPWIAINGVLKMLAAFYLATPLGLPLLAGLLLAWGATVRAGIGLAAVPTAGLMLASTSPPLPHYLAPAFGAFLVVAAAGLERVARWNRAGRLFIAILVGVSLGWCGYGITREAREARETPSGIKTRPLLMERLQQQGERHLVIVRYGPHHNVHQSWIYNRANIDGSDIVWADDMGVEKNRELLDYYPDRKAWLLQPDLDPLALVPYPAP